MKEKLIKSIQKFLNQGFKKSELLIFLDKKRDDLISPKYFNKLEKNEYNSFWDLILHVEKTLSFMSDSDVAMSEINVKFLFNRFLNQRNNP
jgi:hypothetical protein